MTFTKWAEKTPKTNHKCTFFVVGFFVQELNWLGLPKILVQKGAVAVDAGVLVCGVEE